MPEPTHLCADGSMTCPRLRAWPHGAQHHNYQPNVCAKPREPRESLALVKPRAAKRRLERVLGPTAPSLNEPPQLPRAGAPRPLRRLGLRARTRRRRREPSLSSKHRARATIKVIADTSPPSGAGLARTQAPRPRAVRWWRRRDNRTDTTCLHPNEPAASGLTFRFSRVAGIEDSYAGKTRQNNQNLRWRGAVATSAASGCY
jgi:hypothetical protein